MYPSPVSFSFQSSILNRNLLSPFPYMLSHLPRFQLFYILGSPRRCRSPFSDRCCTSNAFPSSAGPIVLLSVVFARLIIRCAFPHLRKSRFHALPLVILQKHYNLHLTTNTSHFYVLSTHGTGLLSYNRTYFAAALISLPHISSTCLTVTFPSRWLFEKNKSNINLLSHSCCIGVQFSFYLYIE
jgi:hypothetical protein